MNERKTKPGACIADIPDVTLKIKARKLRIDQLMTEMAHDLDKIVSLLDEIKELEQCIGKTS